MPPMVNMLDEKWLLKVIRPLLLPGDIQPPARILTHVHVHPID